MLDATLDFKLESFSFRKKTPLLQNIAFCLASNSRLFILGGSGTGKSTLLKLLMGLLTGGRGSLALHGDTLPLDLWKNEGGFFSLVPQSPQLMPWRTVDANLRIAQPSSGNTAELSLQRLQLLNSMGLEQAQNLYPGQISQGMAARVSFARALLLKAHCLLLDEPFAALDAINRARLQDWLHSTLAQLSIPCVFVTHDVREALRLGTQIMVLKGTPATCVDSFVNFEDTPTWEKKLLAAL